MNPKLIEKILTRLVKYPSDTAKNIADNMLGFDFDSPLLWWLFSCIVEFYSDDQLTDKRVQFFDWIARFFKIIDDIGRQLQQARKK